MATVDWNAAFDAASKPEEVIAVSTYPAVIESAEWKVSSNNNNMFVLRFKIEGGSFNGRALWHRIVVNPGGSQYALQKSLEQLKDLGLTQQVLQTTDERTQCDAVVGIRVNVTTKMGSYQGKPQAEVDYFVVAGEVGAGTVAPPPVAAAQPAAQAAPPAATAPVVEPQVAPVAAPPAQETAPVTPPPPPFGG